MYMNTTYKAFVAETAARVAAEISKQFTSNNDVSLLTLEKNTEKIAEASVCIANRLAYELEDWWNHKRDDLTSMFDTEDSTTSNIEHELSGIAAELSEINTLMHSSIAINVVDNISE